MGHIISLRMEWMVRTPDSGALDPVSLAEYKLVILLFWKVQEATGHVSLATESLL